MNEILTITFFVQKILKKNDTDTENKVRTVIIRGKTQQEIMTDIFQLAGMKGILIVKDNWKRNLFWMKCIFQKLVLTLQCYICTQYLLNRYIKPQ